MDERFDRSTSNQQIREEAAEWLVQFNADVPDAQARIQFDQWLRTSPEHIRAYIELLPLWHDSASLAEVNALSQEELVAIVTRSNTNVTSLELTVDVAARSVVRKAAGVGIAPTGRFFAIAATLLIAFAALLLIYAIGYSGTRRFTTDIAEVRTVTLQDGTRLSIGARSAVAVRYTKTARTFLLKGGDIYVEVAKDATRPFVVQVKDKVIRALGTQFEVRADERAMHVAVVEGSVSVSDASAGRVTKANAGAESNAVLLSAGQQLTTRSTERLTSPQPIRSKEPAAWRVGRLEFDNANLGEVIQEFNRYNVKQLKLVDRSLETIPIAAAFSSTDPAALIRFLQDQPGVVVTETRDEILIEAR